MAILPFSARMRPYSTRDELRAALEPQWLSLRGEAHRLTVAARVALTPSDVIGVEMLGALQGFLSASEWTAVSTRVLDTAKEQKPRGTVANFTYGCGPR